MYCRNCGKEIKEGNKFCAGCGTPVKVAIQESAQVQEKAVYQTESAGEVASEAKPKKKKKRRVILWIIIIVLLLGIAGTGIYLYLNDNNFILNLLNPDGSRLEGGIFRQFEDVYDLDEEDMEAYVEPAEEYLEMGKYEEAYKVLNQGFEATEAEIFEELMEYVKENVVLVRMISSHIGQRSELKHDENGNLIKRTTYDEDDNIIQIMENKYDDAGNMIVSILYEQDEKNEDFEIVSRAEREYDESNNMVKSISYREDGTVNIQTVYKYNGSDNVVKKIVYKGDGSIQSQTMYEYDECGNKVKESYYSEDGSADTQTVFEYDEFNKLVKESMYFEGELIDQTRILYDNFDMKIKEVDDDGYSSVYVHDELGNVTSYVTSYKDEIRSSTKYEYSFIGKAKD